MKSNLTKTHAIVFGSMLVVFTILTFLITNAGVDQGAEHHARVLEATAGTITGPLTGAISRGFQECCLEFSLAVMAYCGPVLGIAILLQFVKLPERMWSKVLRMAAWSVGWLAWFLGGILSFAHALS